MKIEGDMPKVSIVVPVYNVEKYLDRCIDSLVNQTLKDIEIILVDDGSPDNCPQMCDAWADRDSRIKVVHKENGGLGSARNAGLAEITGKYVAFVDSDDFVELNTYSTLFDVAQEEQCDVVYMGYTNHCPNGECRQHCTFNFLCSNHSGIKKYIAKFLYECDKHADSGAVESACMSIYRSSIIKDNNVRFMSEREYLSEDTLFNMDFFAYCTKLRCVPVAYYHYCYNETSLTHSFKEAKLYNNFRLCEALIERLRKYGMGDMEWRALLYCLKNLRWIMKDIILSNMRLSRKKFLFDEIYKYDGWSKLIDKKLPINIAKQERLLLLVIKHKTFYPIYFAGLIYYRCFKK